MNVEVAMERMGPSGYCKAHMESGALGQVLYLEGKRSLSSLLPSSRFVKSASLGFLPSLSFILPAYHINIAHALGLGATGMVCASVENIS